MHKFHWALFYGFDGSQVCVAFYLRLSLFPLPFTAADGVAHITFLT